MNSLQATWFLVPNWKWLILAIAAAAGFLLHSISKILFEQLFKKFKTRAKQASFIDYFLGQPLHLPLSWVLTTFFWVSVFDVLNIQDDLEVYCKNVFKLFMIINLIRVCYMAVNAFGLLITEWAKKTENTLDDQLAPFATKTLKLLVVILGFLVALQNFGVNVWSLLAGLGIGGIALALAAQETASNLFGSIQLLLDRPFQVGDHIKVGDTEGNVEEVGFRSTRIRTVYNSLVTLPNSTMAKEKIDNLGVRKQRRIRHVFGITYGTPVKTIENFIDRIRSLLTLVPEVDKEDITVRFQSYGDFSLNILMNFHARIDNIQEEQRLQQDVLLEIMRISEELGVQFAFPTQTIHVAKTT